MRLPSCFVLLAVCATACATTSDDAASATSDLVSETAGSELESRPEGEAQAISVITGIIEKTVLADFDGQPPGAQTAHRDAHAKHHGCVRGSFDVRPDLPNDLRSVVFRPGTSYPTWVRFSNGSGKTGNDQDGDGRGMAIKLVGVPGDKLLPGADHTAVTQDFNLINHDVFFVRTTEDYVDFQKALFEHGSPVRYFFPTFGDSSIPNPFAIRVHEALIARTLMGKKTASPLTTQYFSMAPLLFVDHAVKVAAMPCDGSDHQLDTLPTSPNYLREAMQDTLGKETACFSFRVQRQTDAREMPVEDPTISWEQRESPFVEVARLTVDKQDFMSDARMKYCEDLSFSPWHSAPDHRPLGGLNRTRKVVYEKIASLRHDLNGVVKVEPTDLTVPNE